MNIATRGSITVSTVAIPMIDERFVSIPVSPTPSAFHLPTVAPAANNAHLYIRGVTGRFSCYLNVR